MWPWRSCWTSEGITGRDGYDELRIALVMTGGVSLAVWMGGVTNEINRMLHGDGLYGELLDLMEYTPRVDVITGSSAGGLNGALLATAIVHGQDIAHVREVWAEEGGLDRLLRPALDRSARSLLQGDEVFFKALKVAFADLVAGNRPFQEDLPLREPEMPIRLTVTTTLLDGEPSAFPDDFGSVIAEPDHRGRFCFVRGVPSERIAGINDVVATANDFEGEHAAARLALAVRCSASFPFAFEASYTSGKDGAGANGKTGPHGRPDMASVAQFTHGQFTVDGGVLVNKPVGAALEQVFRQPATAPVRRVLAYVNPLPSGTGAAGTADPDEPPSLSTVVTKSVIGVRSVESLAGDLEELRTHNRHVRDRRDSRDALARSLGNLPHIRLAELALRLYGAYRATRVAGATAHITECIVSEAAWPDRQRVYNLRALDRVLAAAAATAPAPWVPPPLGTNDLGEPAGPLPLGGDSWRWGIFALEGAAAVVLDIVRRAQRLERRTAPGSSSLGELRATVHAVILQAEQIRSLDRDHWRARAPAAFEYLATLSDSTATADQRAAADADLQEWAVASMKNWLREPKTKLPGADPDRRRWLRLAAERLAWVLVAGRPQLLDVLVGAAGGSPSTRAEAATVRGTLDMLAPPGAGALRCLRQILALEVLQGALQTPDRSVDQEVELFQISAATPSALRVSPEPQEKLTGAQLFHFGAFYQRSWRYNDWMWGRLDGAYRVVQLLLEPGRLADIIREGFPDALPDELPVHALALVQRLAVDSEPDADSRDLLAQHWASDQAAIARELAYLAVAGSAPPSSLPASTLALARREQLRVAREEIPALRVAAAADAADDDLHLAPIATVDPDPAARAVAELRTSSVGAARIASDIGSRRFLGLTTRAAVVTTSALENPDAALGPVRRVVRPLRGLMLALYGVALGLTHRSPGAVAALVVALAASGAALTVALTTGSYGELPAVFVLIAAAGALLGVLVWSRRVGALVVGAAAFLVLSVVLALVAVPWFDAADADRNLLFDLRPFVLAVIVIGGLVLLGAVGYRVPPLPHPTRRLVGLTILIVEAAAVITGITLTVSEISSWSDDRDAAEAAIMLMTPVDADKVPAGMVVGPPAVVGDATAFPGVADADAGGLVAHIDLGVSDVGGGVVHAWVFRSVGDADQFLARRTKRGECAVERRRTLCWTRDDEVVIGASSRQGLGVAEALLDVGGDRAATAK